VDLKAECGQLNLAHVARKKTFERIYHLLLFHGIVAYGVRISSIVCTTSMFSRRAGIH